MTAREVVADFAPPRDLLLVSPPNRRAIIVFALLSVVNYGIALLAFMNGRVEAYLSFVLANVCAAAAVLSYFSRNEMILRAPERAIRLRKWIGPVRFERFVPFTEVRSIRLTLAQSGKARDCTVEVVCATREIECPPSEVPRQEALLLAVLMGVPLIKITNDDGTPHREHRLNFN